ncbi:hypothetical protein SAMN02745823_02805 [Sporobacter termitidis DSM 10068]|uniref:Uncharacterized protein n=1 Tax=Sporobacter termitidis DSM 10068 TaxID=1123282 RepID=A0A1M5YSN7_9FIRM|nr:hypothetical protein [Sporobacter termitidis]SHI14959.1 hypothetical protein SAMN02745823_02805 [Sporobacter termitidis DSM 10068]
MKAKKRFLSLALVLVMVLSFSATAFAAPAQTGTVSVSITYGNFTSDTAPGEDGILKSTNVYTGNGFTNANFYIGDFDLDIEYVQEWVDAGLQDMFYLPYDVPSPHDGEANALDAILVAFLENGIGYDNEIAAGWDAYPVAGDPGAYISNVYPQELNYYTPEKVTVEGVEYDVVNGIVTVDGVNYAVYAGTGWNIAITQGGVLKEIDAYATSFTLEDDMEIVFDVSPYVLLWQLS